MGLDLKGYVSLLKTYLKRHRTLLIILFLSMLLRTVFTIFSPDLMGRFVDGVKNKASVNTLLFIGFLFLGSIIFENLLRIIIQYFTENLGWNTTNDLRIDLVKHLMNLDMDFHKKYTSGQLVERIDGDINQLFIFFTTFVTGIVLNAMMIIGCLVYLFIVDYRFLFIEIILIIAFALYTLSIRKPINEISENERIYESDFYGLVSEAVTSVEDIRSFKLQNYIRKKNRRVLDKLIYWYEKSFIIEFRAWGFAYIINETVTVSMLLMASYLAFTKQISLGTVFTVFMIVQLVWEPIEMLRNELQYLENAESSIKRIKELISLKRRVSSGELDFPENAALNVKNLNFSYEENDLILKDVSFKLSPKKTLGILGKTGSGKTTLARVLVKLYESKEDSIFYNTTSLKDISDKSLRSKMAYVTQEVQIFNASARENIRLYKEEISDEKIMEVINTIGLDSWFKKLPDGLDTVFSDDSRFLSSGELQLLTVLRVFLKNPEIIILDEATAKLDPITERLLEKALDLLLKDRTTIIIAHRLKTILRADEILILEDGKIIEHDKKNSLLKDPNSKFSKLLKTGLEEVLS